MVLSSSNVSGRLRLMLSVLTVLLAPAAVYAGINVPSDGSDGAFNPTSSVQIDLTQAVTGVWSDNNSANTGKGIYDPAKWAVVFKYSSVSIPSGVTVSFRNHPTGAPVVWLVQNDAMIAGTVDLNAKAFVSSASLTEPGPGGFPGGPGKSPTQPTGSGHGPGGGGQPESGAFICVGGSYGTAGVTGSGYGVVGPLYGNREVIPLIGGSGGTGHGNSMNDGGAGGGAILLCVGGTATISGKISVVGASGSAGGGSGGGIRIIADTLAGSGTLRAEGATTTGSGGLGRIRIEAKNYNNTISAYPAATISTTIVTDPVIWPAQDAPCVTIDSIGGVACPEDPHFVITTPDHYATVDVSPLTTVTVRMTATNLPSSWSVALRVVPYYGKDTIVQATKVSGDTASSVWEASINLSLGVSALQARASRP